jgi:hypothetical protein
MNNGINRRGRREHRKIEVTEFFQKSKLHTSFGVAENQVFSTLTLCDSATLREVNSFLTQQRQFIYVHLKFPIT